jgi:hypothetical protein
MSESLNYKKSFAARTDDERLLARFGVPTYTWHVKLRDFAFRSAAFRGAKLSARAQRQWCETALLDPPYAPLFVVSSAPTDRAAVAFLGWLFKHRLSRDKRGVFHTGSQFNYQKNYTTICLHNVLNEATPARREEVRNVMAAYDDAFRCVAVAGSKNPEAWALNTLRMRPTAVFYLKDDI